MSTTSVGATSRAYAIRLKQLTCPRPAVVESRLNAVNGVRIFQVFANAISAGGLVKSRFRDRFVSGSVANRRLPRGVQKDPKSSRTGRRSYYCSVCVRARSCAAPPKVSEPCRALRIGRANTSHRAARGRKTGGNEKKSEKNGYVSRRRLHLLARDAYDHTTAGTGVYKEPYLQLLRPGSTYIFTPTPLKNRPTLFDLS